MSSDPTGRFSTRAGDYARYRPGYPDALFDDLDRLAWSRQSVVADIGAGTGLFTRLVAPRVTRVLALEPNHAMRAQGALDSAGFPSIEWRAATGEHTGLDDSSVDALTCAQAFHWMDRNRCRAEWRRILKPGAAVVLVWNERDVQSDLDQGYESLLNRWCPEYPQVNHKNVGLEALEAFFAPSPITVLTHHHEQVFDLEGWKGRLHSASYCPLPGQVGHDELMDGLATLFAHHQRGDRITVSHTAKAYLGSLTQPTSEAKLPPHRRAAPATSEAKS